MVVFVVIYRRHHRKPGPLALLLSTPSFPLPHLSYLVYFLCLPSSVSSSKFGIPQLLCLPLLRKLPGCVPTIPILERVHSEQSALLAGWSCAAGEPLIARHSTQVLSFHILAHSFALFCTHAKLNPFLFKRFRTLCKKKPSGGPSAGGGAQ